MTMREDYASNIKKEIEYAYNQYFDETVKLYIKRRQLKLRGFWMTLSRTIESVRQSA